MINSEGLKEFQIKTANMCGCPKDVLAGLPIISLLGDYEIVIENFKNIIEYTCSTVQVLSKIGMINIDGENLTIKLLNKDEIAICGKIKGISFGGVYK